MTPKQCNQCVLIKLLEQSIKDKEKIIKELEAILEIRSIASDICLN